jgi:restriction system protein
MPRTAVGPGLEAPGKCCLRLALALFLIEGGGGMTDQARHDLPVWHYFIRFVLEALSSGETVHRKELQRKAVELANLTEEQKALTFNDGQVIAEHRTGWAMSALTRAACVSKPDRGYFRISDAGRELLAGSSGIISDKDLRALPAWNEYEPTRHSNSKVSAVSVYSDADSDPIERISSAVEEIEQAVAAELLTKLREGSPEFFERAVLELLKKMGYGGVENTAYHTGKSGDGGIDGVLDQDALGLNRVHVQAKRYGEENTIGRPDIQRFVGALGDRGASQGVFVTTSKFSREATETADRAREKIALIDGSKFVELMIKYRVGVQVENTHYIVEVDEDFFE